LIKKLFRSACSSLSISGQGLGCNRINRYRIIWSVMVKTHGSGMRSLGNLIKILCSKGIKGVRSYLQDVFKDNLKPRFGNHYKEIYDIEDESLLNHPGEIAICIQLSRIERLDGIIRYLSDLPFEYSIYIAVKDKRRRPYVKEKLKDITNCKRMMLPVLKERSGYPVPLLVACGKEIRKSAMVCYIHDTSSISMHNDSDYNREQSFFHDLQKARENTLSIFSILDRYPQIGLIYPKPLKDLPYGEFTRLSEGRLTDALFQRLCLHRDFSHYIDYPAGSIFWAKTEAIKPLLNPGLIKGLHRGEVNSLHPYVSAMERLLIPVLQSRGMTFSEIDFENGTYAINRGSKNLWQYWNKSSEDLHASIDQHEVISFDIFDTLITRPVLFPDTGFKIIEIRVKKELGVVLNFKNFRKQAEMQTRKARQFTGDCSIDDIYDEFQRLTSLSTAHCEAIKRIEIQNELELCLPREAVVTIFNYAKSKGKRVVLISDIYLGLQDIEAMLLKCGISGYERIFLSSVADRRKDTGELWDFYNAFVGAAACLHIGDNEHSDVLMAQKRKFSCYHVMSGRNIFLNSALGKGFVDKFKYGIESGDSAGIGTVVSKEFNNPFRLHPTKGRYVIKDLKTLGYVIFGPIFITFITWLIRNVNQDKRDLLLFLAREGYAFQKFYTTVMKSLNLYGVPVKAVDNRYLLASRRAVSVASIETEEDFLDILEAPYRGTVANLLISRFGIESDKAADEIDIVSLPEDLDKVHAIVKSYQEEIILNAKTERDGYSEYCKELELFKYKNIAIIDLGYSGSMQYYLSKIIHKPTIGYYFMTRRDLLKGTRYKGNIMKDCFSFIDKDANHSINSIYAFMLIFEGLLTSPDGQFIKFRNDHNVLKPVYDSPGHSQAVFSSLNQIYEGILEFMKDMVRLHGRCLLDYVFTQKVTQFLLEHIVLDEDALGEEIRNLFTVEDKYCSDDEISVFDYYKSSITAR